MVDFNNAQIPPPKNWQDFESLCADLWQEIWADPDTQKNGRGGQRQYGVDVYGQPGCKGIYEGVQCKGKDGRYGNQVTETELRDEVEGAKSFKPKLSKFILATTAENDQHIQSIAREITELHRTKGLFQVIVYSWDEIQRRINQYPGVLRNWYPNWTYNNSQPFLLHQNSLPVVDPPASVIQRVNWWISYHSADSRRLNWLWEELGRDCRKVPFDGTLSALQNRAFPLANRLLIFLSDHLGKALAESDPEHHFAEWDKLTIKSIEARSDKVIVIAIDAVTMPFPHVHDLSHIFERNDSALVRDKFCQIMQQYGGFSLSTFDGRSEVI